MNSKILLFIDIIDIKGLNGWNLGNDSESIDGMCMRDMRICMRYNGISISKFNQIRDKHIYEKFLSK